MEYTIEEVLSKFTFEDYIFPVIPITIGIVQLTFGVDIISVGVFIVEIFLSILLLFLSYYHAKTQLRFDESREELC